MTTTRRQLLLGGAALAAASTLGVRSARASVDPAQRRFVFVFARGGWDNTRVFSPMQDAPSVWTEPDAVVRETAGLPWVDHVSRPSTRAFFQRYADRCAVLDGMLVRSVNHRVCERLVLTGSSRADGSDWASVLGAAVADAHALPSVVLGGPSLPGTLHRFSSIVGERGQVQALLDGSVFDMGDLRSFEPPQETTDRVERVLTERLARRLDAEADPAMRRMLEAYDDGLARVRRLRDDARLVAFEATSVVASLRNAADMLRHGVARCVSVVAPAFDTHTTIDLQTGRFEELFGGLLVLMEELDRLPGRAAPTLADETTVVVLSEMGRTPYLNARVGKDHWPYTAAMLIGSGVRGGQRVGGYDDALNGLPVDLRTGRTSGTGTPITPEHLGATLLLLGGVDPSTRLPGVPAVETLLA